MGNVAATKQSATGNLGVMSEPAAKTPNLWQLPLTLYAGWWTMGMAAFWLPEISPHHEPHRDLHEQLIVPEAVAAEIDQSLFA